jgi:molybdopterin-containing oxidoreductase family iron-sulfur binding subunit
MLLQTGAEQALDHHWGMVMDLDACTGCGACVVACQAENNIPINDEEKFRENRAIEWIRIERYWTTTEHYDEAQPKYMPMLCQHCESAPCEPVCPVYATYHTSDGLNAQIYNRCIGTRYCGNNCPWNVRFFNFHEPKFEGTFQHHLNPDVTVRSRGIMEKCTMCVHRIRRGVREARYAGTELQDGDIQTACQQSCPTNAIIFGDMNDPDSEISRFKASNRNYQVLGELGTNPGVSYLAKFDVDAAESEEDEHAAAPQAPVIWMTVNG